MVSMFCTFNGRLPPTQTLRQQNVKAAGCESERLHISRDGFKPSAALVSLNRGLAFTSTLTIPCRQPTQDSSGPTGPVISFCRRSIPSLSQFRCTYVDSHPHQPCFDLHNVLGTNTWSCDHFLESGSHWTGRSLALLLLRNPLFTKGFLFGDVTSYRHFRVTCASPVRQTQ